MIIGRFRNRAFLLLAISVATLATVSCSSNETKVKRMLEAYLKPHGVTEIIVDFFYTDPKFPNQAYASATVTYGFANAEGRPQREALGYILAREGDTWKIAKNASYTTEQEKAATYLAGGK